MLAGLLLQPLGMPISEAEWRPRMERYARGGQWQRAVSLLSSVRQAGGELSPGAYQAAISACARAEPPQWRTALNVLEQSRAHDEVSPKVWCAAIHACRTEWRVALTLLRRMQVDDDLPLSSHAATATVRALGDAGEWRRALELFNEVADTPSHDDDLCIDGQLLQATMLACARAGRVRETLDLLNHAPPGASCAAELMSASSTSAGAAAAGDVGADDDVVDYDGIANDALDHTVVVAYANARRFDDGRALLRARRDRKLPAAPNTYHAMLRAARAAAEPETSLLIFDDLVSSGLPLSDTSYALGLGPPLMRDASWRAALRQLAAVLASRAPPSARAQEELLAKCADGAQAEAAEALLQLLSECGACSARTLPRLCERGLEACAKARAPLPASRILAVLEEEAEAASTRALAAGDARFKPMLRPAAYSSAMDACPAWAWQTAVQMWRQMRKAQVEPDARCGLSAMRAMRRGARWRESVALLKCLERRHGLDADAELLGTCVGACELAGAWWPALQVHQRLPYDGRSMRKERGLALLAAVCRGERRVEAPAVKQVVTAVVATSGAYEIDDVHAALGLAALGGQWEAALQVMRSLNRPLLGTTRGADDVDGYSDSEGGGEGGSQVDGRSGGESGGDLSDAMRLRLRPDPMTFSLLISAAERGAQWALLLRLHSALSRDGLWRRQGQENEAGYDAVATQAAVNAHCALGDWRAALRLLQAMESFGLRPSRDTCERVLFTMSRAGLSSDGAAACDAAGRLLQHMLAEGPAPGRAGFEAVVHALARRGRVAECRRVMDEMVTIGDIDVEVSTLNAAFGGVLADRRMKTAGGAYRGDGSAGPPESPQPDGAGAKRRGVPPQTAAMLLQQVHALYEYGVGLGLLRPVSSSLVDVRALPPPVAVGSVLATLESLRQRPEEPSTLITAPLTIRAEAHSPTLTKCRKAITRWARVTDGQRPPLVVTPPPAARGARLNEARDDTDGGRNRMPLASPLVDDLFGHELVIPMRSLRSWLRAARKSDRKRSPISRRGAKEANEAYWESTSTLGER